MSDANLKIAFFTQLNLQNITQWTQCKVPLISGEKSLKTSNQFSLKEKQAGQKVPGGAISVTEENCLELPSFSDTFLWFLAHFHYLFNIISLYLSSPCLCHVPSKSKLFKELNQTTVAHVSKVCAWLFSAVRESATDTVAVWISGAIIQCRLLEHLSQLFPKTVSRDIGTFFLCSSSGERTMNASQANLFI